MMLLLLHGLQITPFGTSPPDAQHMTLYHVNPKPLGPVPVNMNVADGAGDLFFDMHNSLLEPLECPHGAASGHGCSNPEASGLDLVVNKVVLNVEQQFSGYAKCNIGVNGTDGHGNPCADDTYCCYCSGASRHGPNVPCNATVGRENVREHFSSEGDCGANDPNYECWRANLGLKFTDQTPGFWYSPQTLGYCPTSTECTWDLVSVEKIVNKTCHDEVLWKSVQAADTSSCFKQCSPVLNSTDPCWIGCFFTTVLGPYASVPGGNVSGMPLADVVAAWEKPFLDVSEGGCPALPIPSRA